MLLWLSIVVAMCPPFKQCCHHCFNVFVNVSSLFHCHISNVVGVIIVINVNVPPSLWQYHRHCDIVVIIVTLLSSLWHCRSCVQCESVIVTVTLSSSLWHCCHHCHTVIISVTLSLSLWHCCHSVVVESVSPSVSLWRQRRLSYVTCYWLRDHTLK